MPLLTGGTIIGEVFAECVKKHFDLLGRSWTFISCRPATAKPREIGG